MNDSARKVVKDLRDHIEREMRDRNARPSYVPNSDEKRERERLMEQLLLALGVSKPEIQSRLGIGRATWDRWRAMTTVPRKTYIEALERLATDDGGVRAPIRMPLRHHMLNATPRSWGRLRLVLSSYDWSNAVFLYSSPFDDEQTVTEMMLLALRGCSIVYIAANAEGWSKRFADVMVNVIGTVDAARALSHFCIVNVPAEEATTLSFFILNFATTDPAELRVAYHWTGDPARPNESKDKQYDALPGDDQRVFEVEDKYGKVIAEALGRVHERQREWGVRIAPEEIQSFLKIPIVEFHADKRRTS
jgi:hypothetical protein